MSMGFDAHDMLFINITPDLVAALRSALSDMKNPVELRVFVDDGCELCPEVIKLAKALRDSSPGGSMIKLSIHHRSFDREAFGKYGVTRVPAMVMIDGQIRYTGVPAGEELKGLVETIIRVSQGDHGLPREVATEVASVKCPMHIEVFVTPPCPYCPYAALLANMFAYVSWRHGNKNIVSEIVEAFENPDRAQRYYVMTVPTVVVNGDVAFVGLPREEDLLAKVKEKERECEEQMRRRREELFRKQLRKYVREHLSRLEDSGQ